VVLELIAERRKASTRPDDLLTLLLAAQDEEGGGGMTDQQLKDEALTLLTAGHETVGAALAWTWYLLGQHPQVQEDLHDEVRGKLQGRAPTLEDLPELPLTRAVFEETLRLYPPAWGQPREPIQTDEVNGYPIPAKAIVTLSQWVTHRHPHFWDEPEEFRPQRFLPGESEGRHRFAYFPFGGGPRVCIGNTFALLEGPLVLATLAQRFRVELAPGQVVVPDPTFTLRPRNGVKVILRPR
jgi:cytochrome P450